MLTVTETAGARLKHMLADSDEAAVVRIIRRKQRVRLRLSESRPGDTSFSHDGRVVLVLGEKASRALDARTLDVRETGSGPRLSLKKPR